MGEDDPPTQEQIIEIRQKIQEYLTENGKEVFDSRDVESLMSNDHLVSRYFMHIFDLSGDQVDNAVNMIINSFKWRLQTGIADISESDLNNNLKERGVLYMHNHDRDGKPLIVFDVKKHSKGKEKVEDMKNFFLYFVERADRETKGGKVTLVFDCAGCGLKNMDMEFIQFMISVFKDNTPYNLNYILVFEMPWVLNAAWKVIKSWLPAAAVKKIKFLNKSNVGEFIDPDQRFVAWGGEDTWEYKFEPEKKLSSTPNGDVEDVKIQTKPNSAEKTYEEIKRKVHFSRMTATDRNSTTSEVSSMSRNSSFGSAILNNNYEQLLNLTPPDEVVFSENGNQGDLMGVVSVQNTSSNPVAFKIKTTSPDKYRVKPSMASLASGSTIQIEIHVQSAQIGSVSSLIRDKFLITVIKVDRDVMTHQQISELMKSSKPDGQHRLRCTLAASVEGSSIMTSRPLPTPGSGVVESDTQAKQLETLMRKMNSLVESNEKLQDDLSLVKKMLVFLITLSLVVIFVLWWQTSGLYSVFCDSADVLDTKSTSTANSFQPKMSSETVEL